MNFEEIFLKRQFTLQKILSLDTGRDWVFHQGGLEFIIENSPYSAFVYLSQYLTSQQLDDCAVRMGLNNAMREDSLLQTKISHTLLDECIFKFPLETLLHYFRRINTEQFLLCLEYSNILEKGLNSPHTAPEFYTLLQIFGNFNHVMPVDMLLKCENAGISFVSASDEAKEKIGYVEPKFNFKWDETESLIDLENENLYDMDMLLEELCEDSKMVGALL